MVDELIEHIGGVVRREHGAISAHYWSIWAQVDQWYSRRTHHIGVRSSIREGGIGQEREQRSR